MQATTIKTSVNYGNNASRSYSEITGLDKSLLETVMKLFAQAEVKVIGSSD